MFTLNYKPSTTPNKQEITMFNRKSLTRREFEVLNQKVNDLLDSNEVLEDKVYTFKVVQGIALDSNGYKFIRDNRLQDNRKV